ncbi:streptogrisin B precursor [Actinomadura graeca]|uniref:Streptogrisin B n=1 Tax=Actinomadura graeca TaxID=2750812 RepID=A0ABX8QQP8_9ACTN|nr:S1 family peptidase [Actinomadura graeca]QXJ21118.1 streptogrisin B precursor [Actinomadura graeca]
MDSPEPVITPHPVISPEPETSPSPVTSPAPEPSQAPEAGTDENPGLVAVPSAEGGESIFARGGVRCTLGFNVRRSGTYYFLTTGACAEVGLKIYADRALTVELGTVVAVTNTTALVRYVSPRVERPGSVRTPAGSQDVVAARSPRVGQRICRTSPITGITCGTVTARDQSMRFHEGTLSGLARTTTCARLGETPGAPYVSGPYALGLRIGVGGNCSRGGSSFFQPVDDVLRAFGVNVY